MPIPLSAFIIARDEEARLPATLAALRGWVDEIVLVDSGSTDRTVEIARAHGATVIHREWTGYGPQKRFAEEQCRNDWLLNLDADEVVTKALASEIEALFGGSATPEPGAYKVRILNVYPGDSRPRPLANDYNVVRLYHRAAGRYSDHPLHDRVELSKQARPKQLEAPVWHYPFASFEQAIEKFNRFSSFSAANSKAKKPWALGARLFVEFPVVFVKFYLFRLHMLGGWKGFYFSICNAFMRTSRIAKMLETETRHEARPQERRAASEAPASQSPETGKIG